MNGDNEKTETIRVEWGHRIEWPDGHSEFKRDSDRDAADYAVMVINQNRSRPDVGPQHVKPGKTATLHTRTVTTSPWTQI
jgi:hypothetical protein